MNEVGVYPSVFSLKNITIGISPKGNPNVTIMGIFLSDFTQNLVLLEYIIDKIPIYCFKYILGRFYKIPV